MCLVICSAAYPQDKPPMPVRNPDLKNFSLVGHYIQGMLLISSGDLIRTKHEILLDSLKEKALRRSITRKLYEIIVISPGKGSNSVTDTRSEAVYDEFSGRKIRNIGVNRLPVFGSNINNPDYYEPYRSQKFLNRTHINTSESIIRKNLLFSTGDTLSPILLSENEKLLRDLPYIEDARIKIIPLGNNEVDVIVITKDVYSLGGDLEPSGLKSGRISAFDNNIFGLGHDLGINVPFDSEKPNSPGFGIHYLIDNLGSSFVNLNMFYNDDLEEDSYGIRLSRKFVSSETKYAGGVSVEHVYKFNALDTLKVPEPLRYNLQDYWIGRSFLLDRENVTRLVLSARYTNNNVLQRPSITPDSYHSLQKYRLFLGSVALSRQRYYRANLIYEYGRTEDIPYGGVAKVTMGRELNEFKTRNYAGSELSVSGMFPRAGYLYSAAGLGSYLSPGTEQGIIYTRFKYFTNLIPVAGSMIRNFVNLDYTRGFDRNADEKLTYIEDNGFSGFRNDSIKGTQRLTLNLETVVFSPLNIYGFRFAFFGFADFSYIAGTNQVLSHGNYLSGIGVGIRVRNNNLVFNTFQLRLGFFPDPPLYSRINYLTVTGQQPTRFDNFESGPPSLIPYR
ncbi:MAG TPA: hypothetical protein VK155_15170 [Bacteroidales bacterium]|nr:hypothetical protein [Bacteroidales bacterium]